MKDFKFHIISRKGKKNTNEKKNRSRTNNDENEKDDENFIINIVNDRTKILRDAMAENDDYVKFEKTNSSDENVQIRLKPDR